MALLWWAVTLAAAAAEPRFPPSSSARPWRHSRTPLEERAPRQFVGPHVCRAGNSTHCCPGWTARPNSLRCVVPLCRPDCGGGPCIAPNMCRCPSGVEAPSCIANGNYPYSSRSPVSTPGGCRRICMNGGTCRNATCECAPGWTGEYCTEPICRQPCLHGGRCIAPDRCVCFQGLSGTRCEIDRRTGPCYTSSRGALCTGAVAGVVCTRQLCCASVGRAWGHPCERCGDLDCPQGHLRNLHTHQCQDIDECAAIPGLCSGGKCINSPGSFSCECPPGQRRHPDSNNCEDIDECDNPDICPNGKCVNTEGDYYCLCNPHFIPSPDKKYCIDGRVGNCFTFLGETGECGERLSVPLSNRDCCCGYNMGRAWGDLCAPCPPRGAAEWTHLCGGSVIPPDWRRNDSDGNFNNDNELGYGNGNGYNGYGNGIDKSAQHIAKIDECLLRSDICGLGTCIDKDVGYSCECWAGAEAAQVEGSPTCMDVDECALDYCRGGRCLNTPGSFQCRCPPGFDPVDNGKRCSDQNECETTGVCSNGQCINIDGGFECACLPGYSPTESGASCIDVDECAQGAGEAGGVCRRGRCRNAPGSYSCECAAGYAFSPAGYCADVDECRDDPALCEGGRCVNTEGGWQCVCDSGYRPAADRRACTDVDECTGDVCRNAVCHNAPGSFRCDCRPGFTLAPDGRSCRDEVEDLCYEKYDEGTCRSPGSIPVTRSQCCCSAVKGVNLGWGVGCSACPAPGSREYATLCGVELGGLLPEGGRDNAGADINECTMVPGACVRGACENTAPGYRCICDPGFMAGEDGHCRDVDECDLNQSYCAGGQCRNTIGSFECICGAGTRYNPVEQLCVDIDECDEQSNPCENGRCINTHGSYNCECEPGFVLDASARKCLDNRRGSCWRRVVEGRCEEGAGALLRQECCCGAGLAWGSPCEPCDTDACACRPGHAKLDGETCRDLDECALDPTLCAGGTCVNTDGSYHCECPPGLVLDTSKTRCLDLRVGVCWAGAGVGAVGAGGALGGVTEGRCGRAVAGALSRAACCCSALGRAWGEPRCEPCPGRGTDAYKELCIAEFEGGIPMVVERPNGLNASDIYSHINNNGYDDNGYGNGLGNGFNNGYGGNANVWTVNPGGSEHGLLPGQPDVNECVAFPGICGHGRCKNLPGSFTCDCQPGYEMDVSRHGCVDVDECSVVTRACGPPAAAAACHNAPGSFSCACRAGYRAHAPLASCTDIDECAESPSLCRLGRCVNTPGSFRCECSWGMELAPDGLYCKDIDECSLTSGICSNGACENLMATYQCVCDEGYAQTSVKSHCEDIDECAEDPNRCEHECVNTPGSYHCTCRDGWKLRADGWSCRDVDECQVPRVCGGGECRNSPGAYSCECGTGLVHSDDDPRHPTCRDVDECAEIPDLCGAGECHNTVGSFVCACLAGYSVTPAAGPACRDDDECELGTCDCHPQADCVNLPGSFECRCREGWRGSGAECEDVDECVSLPHRGGCHPRALCNNTPGTHECLCDQGYRGDGYQCEDIDECANDPALCENGRCSNTPGGFECDCDVGFIKSPDSRACLDLDECSTFDNVCVFGRCENTYGMFKCICDKGYQPDSVNDDLSPGFNCTDVDECLSPQSCQYGRCVNTPGGYECRCPRHHDLVADGTACFDARRAQCYGQVARRAGGEQCRDSDELSEDASQPACCCSVGVAWGNYCDLCPEPGSEEYQQLCPGGPGYMPILEPPSYVVTLADIDECAVHTGLCANGTCSNTFGSYLCKCGEGWRLDPLQLHCEDIDECLIEGICGPGVCRNLAGSYVCLCPEGYVPMPSGKECVDVRQRPCYMEVDERGECSNAVGVPQTKYLCCCSVGKAWGAPCALCPERGGAEHVALCGEKPGEYINPVTNTTAPIDECRLVPQLCRPGTCHDTPAGFTCSCEHGFTHDKLSHVCRDVDECADSPCPRLASCINLQGSYKCHCPAGYRLSPTGEECEDVDECESELYCTHGTCRNTLGSFRCECAPGYTLRDNVCVDIDECSRPRPMCRNGTCENLPGSYRCHCEPGFKPGANNDCVDIDECRSAGAGYGAVCRNGRCINTVGSYTCRCGAGYVPDGGAGCRDLDECTETENPCGTEGEPVCTNTRGGYECACAVGWRLAGRRCVDRDECRDSDLCAPGLCHNFDGGFRCECPPEWRFDKEAAVCVDERRELCYDEWEAGRCHAARPLQLSRPECCCSEGAAWGRFCERCPPRDSAEFLQVCQGGMGRPNLTQDLDECAVRPDVCRGGRCVNTDGSFRCECPPGFTLDGSGVSCIDVDECVSEPRVCGNGSCSNTRGGYECHCNKGFMQGPDQRCVDVDECLLGVAECAFRCHNTVGGFRCTCPAGYTPRGSACEDIDECAHDPPCEHCTNTVGSYVCGCPEGYRRTSSPHSSASLCEDVDECLESSSLCGPGTCHNEDGGFRCECPPGFRSQRDDCVASLCEDVDECADSASLCGPGTCHNEDGGFRCECPPGFRSQGDDCVDVREGACYRTLVGGRCEADLGGRRGSYGPAALAQHVTKAQCCCTLGAAWGDECEPCPPPGSTDRLQLCNSAVPGVVGSLVEGALADVDECQAMPGLCAPGRCVNTIGSFRCVCGRGYRWVGAACVDVDECLLQPPRCEQLCNNTDGGYTCGCSTGYELGADGSRCVDVDECVRGVHTCQQQCANTRGSYTCSCRDGYEKQGDACIDINECLEEGICPTPGKCVNLLGSYRCVCPRGFRLSIEGDRCVDRDECAEGLCSAPCRNYAGSYNCQCPPGTRRSALGGCEAVDPCLGAPCGAAQCVALGAAYRCGCPPGYGWQQDNGMCLQLGGGCASSNCLFACHPYGDSYQCGCPDNYNMMSGHCVSPVDQRLPTDDIGSAPVFPVRDQYRTETGADLISTEGCFSCQMNARHRRAPDEGIVYANGTTILRRRRRRTRRGRRSLLEPEAELIVINVTPKQTWARNPILNLLPAEGKGKPHYRIAYGDDNKDFVLSKHNGVFSLRLRRHIKQNESLNRQIEVEARFVPVPSVGKRKRDRRHVDLNVPAPLRLYVTVKVAPPNR